MLLATRKLELKQVIQNQAEHLLKFITKFQQLLQVRSHLEQLPIPFAEEQTQREIEKLVDILLIHDENSPVYQETFALLDKKIADLFSLTREEYELLCSH